MSNQPPVPDYRPLIADCRARLQTGQADLSAAFLADGNAEALLTKRAALVDQVLLGLWEKVELAPEISLVAVGGYGRGELYPGSDVDLLVLVPTGFDPAQDSRIEQMVGLLWDIGLDVGHSVRNPDECVAEADNDITIQTALLEARLLAGNDTLFVMLQRLMARHLNAADFFRAKMLEQEERYAKHNDTPYSLEPSCKESPGGLRDLQIIRWVARAAGIGDNWPDLLHQGLVTEEEARKLEEAESFLSHLRIHLHLVVKRKEERLLFDHQEKLAQAMGITRTETRRASEMLMQRYYRNAKLVTQLNMLVLQNLAEKIVPRIQAPPWVIDSEFQTVRNLIDIRDEDVFRRRPAAMLSAFLILEKRGELKGMTTRTLRALWRNRELIDENFRRDLVNRALFIKLFQQPHVIRTLRLMNQFDILGQYLPNFGRIVGQMQHDLFHVYTVDQHIMQVIRNLRRFSMPEYAHEYPFCTRLFSSLDRPWLLYIAALFHDIAKGRGGDHSEKGMADAREFCVDHGLSEEDTELVVFLVKHHLNMSAVAQKQDLADPDTIRDFAAIVGDQRHLTALYLLTVADIRGTSPKVWNLWKGKLLEDLFRMTSRLLRGDSPMQAAGIAERQEMAATQLRLRGLRPGVENDLWSQLDTGYFMQHDPDEIAWHSRILYHRVEPPEPVIRARINPIGEGLQVMVFVPDQPDLFARLCGFFARHGYSIADAKIHTTRHGYALDSFVLLNAQDHLPYRDMIGIIEHELFELLRVLPPLEPTTKGRLPRQVKHFPIQPQVVIRADEKGNRYVMSIIAADRPGLLYSLAYVLGRHKITLHTAKVVTLGDRVEDTFLISGTELAKTPTLVKLEQELLETLQV